jgi:hypothetical protein
MRRWLGLFMIGAGLCCTGLASAQEADGNRDGERPKSAARGQEHFGVGATLGFFNPSGVSLRGGARAASLEVTGGFMPSLLSYGSSRDPQLKFIAPFELTPQLLFEVAELKRELRAGLRLGYRYNWALGHGGSAGGQIGKRFGHFLLEGVFGLTVYPGAADRLRGEEVPAGASFNFPPALNWGFNVSFFYDP